MADNKIRKYRKKLNLTIKDLAERTGLSIGYISQLERDEAEPSLSSLRKIAKEFDVPIYVLIEEEKENDGLTIRREERISVHTKKNVVEYEFLTPLPSQNFLPRVLDEGGHAAPFPGQRDSDRTSLRGNADRPFRHPEPDARRRSHCPSGRRHDHHPGRHSPHVHQ